jgi:hypothetical protein
MQTITKQGALDADVLAAINTNFADLDAVQGGTYYVIPRTSVLYNYVFGKYGDLKNSDGTPMLHTSLQEAINRCVHNRGDMINCFPGTQSLTATVLFNKRGITVQNTFLGYAPAVRGERFMLYGASGVPAAKFTEPCTVRGLGFSGQYTGAGSHNVLVDAAGGGFFGGFIEISGCRFATWGASPDYALLLNGATQCLFQDNAFDGVFDGYNVGAIGISKSTDAVQVWQSQFINNRFNSIGENKFAFVHVAGCQPDNNLIKGNSLLGKTTAAGGAPGRGKFLDNNGVTNFDTLVCDNWIGLATDTGSYDDTVAALQALGVRFAGNHYSE